MPSDAVVEGVSGAIGGEASICGWLLVCRLWISCCFLPATPAALLLEPATSACPAGIVATVATYPLMTVNTLQAMRARPPSPVADEEKAGWQQGQRPPPPPLPHSRGTLHELAEVRLPPLCCSLRLCWRPGRAAEPSNSQPGAAELLPAWRSHAVPRLAPAATAPQIVRVGGWPALFSGLEASLIGTTISQGIYFYL